MSSLLSRDNPGDIGEGRFPDTVPDCLFVRVFFFICCVWVGDILEPGSLVDCFDDPDDTTDDGAATPPPCWKQNTL